MDYGKLIGDSFAYMKDGFSRNVATWVILLVLAILPMIPFVFVLALIPLSLVAGGMQVVPVLVGGFAIAFILALLLGSLYMGYQVRVLRGIVPLPEVTGFRSLFVDGIKYLVIQVVYTIPVFIVLAVTAGAAIVTALPAFAATPAQPGIGALLPVLGGIIAGIIIAVIVAFLLGLLATIGIVRFARTGRIGEAFNFSEILSTIRKIGWGSYILALVIMIVLILIVQVVLGLVPYIGFIIQFLVAPLISVFMARYICLLYDSAETPAEPPSTPAP